jgi:hypothetical protein
MITGIRDNISSLEAQIARLKGNLSFYEKNLHEEVSRLQAVCEHPFHEIIEYRCQWESYVHYRLCKLCGLSEYHPTKFVLGGRGCYDEVPKVSYKYAKVLLRKELTRDMKYKLEYPMRHDRKELERLEAQLGKPLFDKLVNKRPHIAGRREWKSFTSLMEMPEFSEEEE